MASMHHRWTLALAAAGLMASACGDRQPAGVELPGPADLPPASLAAESAELNRTLASIRAATAAFHDVNVAVAAGYAQGSSCEQRAQGAMGYHYPNQALLGIAGRRGTPPLVWGTDAAIDLLKPEVLLYAPTADGSLELVAVEYVVFAAAWDAVNAAPPALAGVEMPLMSGQGAHGFEPHYELHVWLWRHNPLGMFAQWNPDVTCAYAPRP